MIRIAITAAAFNVVAKTLPLGSVAYEAETTSDGGRFIWIDRRARGQLDALRGPSSGSPRSRRRAPADGARGRGDHLRLCPAGDHSGRLLPDPVGKGQQGAGESVRVLDVHRRVPRNHRLLRHPALITSDNCIIATMIRFGMRAPMTAG